MELMGWSVGGHLRRIGATSAAQSAVGKQLESCFQQDRCDGSYLNKLRNSTPALHCENKQRLQLDASVDRFTSEKF